ncbi:hypothetical protein KUTeg_023179 [Tegillarca granosa]|uniref:EF-hand domain-containing protein n=1 Tax=Tegillarca granosa TaxID=220873 RepID=A0ABQ9E0W0_TEGGR|nr:hypothetical protein KUTeg_023179 [Tegillarca granosa]
MKLSAFLLAIFVAMLLVDSVECWRRRRFRVRIRVSKIWKPICSPLCSTTCSYVTSCPNCAPACSYVCKKVCKGKREASHELPAHSFIKLMPCDFDIYDTNNDDVISIEELGQQNGETGNEEDVKQMFAVMDANDSSNNGNPKARSLEPELDDENFSISSGDICCHELPANSFIKLMPCDFDIYDTNNDDFISIEELGQQNGESGNEEDVKQMFAVMDANNDGNVSREEFEVAPLMKDCDKKDSSNNGNPKARSLEPELDDMEEDINDLE